MKRNTLTASQIRRMHNSYLEGTITDAIGRHLCRVALGERCIGIEGPMKLRYPTLTEQSTAKKRLATSWNARHE
jgi:hypothetical protein